MKAGLVGFAQSGKTTLFNAMTGLGASTGGAKGKANLGVIKVPDPRVDALSAICKPKKTTPTEVVFVDVPGPSREAKGFDAAAANALKEVDALVFVLGAYDSSMEPTKAFNDFMAELVLGDLDVVEKRLDRMKRDKEKPSPIEQELLERCQKILDDNRPLRELTFTDADDKILNKYNFLSQRPMLTVVNVAEDALEQPLPADLSKTFAEGKVEPLIVCAKLEAEVAALAAEERGAFLKELGVQEPASSQVIRTAYRALDYISFFTVGEDEVKAWTIRRGWKAPKAAARIHSDIERGFIRAEVIAYEDFIAFNGHEGKLREAGKFRLEGKDYVVKDGDCINFRFNV